MNAAGLTVMLGGIVADLNLPNYPITPGHITQAGDKITQRELTATRNIASAALAILKQTPVEKFEATVAQYDADLTATLEKYRAGSGALANFRNLQIFMGHVTTVMNKSGLSG